MSEFCGRFNCRETYSPGRMRGFRSAQMYPGAPAKLCEISIADCLWLGFDRGCHGHIPAREKTSHGNDAGNFDNLLIGPVLSKFCEDIVGNRVWMRAGRDRQIESRAFSGGKNSLVL